MWQSPLEIAAFIIENFLNIWPYLLLTIPLAVAVQLSGASKYIDRAFQARPVTAIFLATLVGAFSPFCSCTVIPVVASLLIGGVPLAPVMAFWIASPAMDPEIFFLSVATLGWELAVWRLAGTLALSLGAGFITHLLFQRGWLGTKILRNRRAAETRGTGTVLYRGWGYVWLRIKQLPGLAQSAFSQPLPAGIGCCETTPAITGGSGTIVATAQPDCDGDSGCDTGCGVENSCAVPPLSFRKRLVNETWQATSMVVQFMALAFLLEAIIILYVPQSWVVGLLGGEGIGTIAVATLVGVPVYTSNLSALALVGGLLAQGMSPAAGLAFLIAGPTTTLPAMAAVWGLTTRRVFGLYVTFALVGALAVGLLYSLFRL
jgi:uncharacterized membrane protein YraQ (UPF0718 family)